MFKKIRSNSKLNLFIIFTRYLLGFSFIPSGYTKAIGERFTSLSTDTPVGFFFEALYQTGTYWNMLGIFQLFTAFLLFSQRFATLGAIFFFCIITNIWMITVSMHFSGTWIITTLMLLATLLLLAWDYDKWKFIFYSTNAEFQKSKTFYPDSNKIWTITGVILFVLSLGGCIAYEPGAASNKILIIALLLSYFLILITALYSNKRVSQLSKT